MKSKPLAFEKFKEDWQRQVMADPTLSPVTFRVRIAINWHMNRKQSGLAWPGMARLAQMVRTTPRTVIRATKQLEAKGHLRIIRSRQRERRGLNRYMPLMKSACHRRDADNADMSVASPGSDQALSLGSDQALSHEPLIFHENVGQIHPAYFRVPPPSVVDSYTDPRRTGRRLVRRTLNNKRRR
jgi:DNA-binding MarR family transcriptional regulator